MSKKTDRREFKQTDIILLGNHKYIVYSIKKDVVELLPIDVLLESDEVANIVPRLEASYELIEGSQKIDPYELLCLLNQTNPLIKKMLEKFLENENK